MATADVLRAAHTILMPAPAPQRRARAVAAAAHHRRAGGSDNHHNHPGASGRRSMPAGTSAPVAGRRQRGGRKARPAAEVYAGPAFSTSPDPSSLPLPQFTARKAVAAVDAAATRNLRLILRLE